MKKERGCLAFLLVMLTVTIGTILSWNSGTKEKVKQPPRTKIIDSVKIDSITIKIYKDE